MKRIKRYLGSTRQNETAVERRHRMMDENDAADSKIRINVFYDTDAGSDPVTIAAIAETFDKNLPFGLKCQRSRVIFIPSILKAYWFWSDETNGPVFTYSDRQDMVNGMKMQYLSHKELITTEQVIAMAKIILYEDALRNLESWAPGLINKPPLL